VHKWRERESTSTCRAASSFSTCLAASGSFRSSSSWPKHPGVGGNISHAEGVEQLARSDDPGAGPAGPRRADVHPEQPYRRSRPGDHRLGPIVLHSGDNSCHPVPGAGIEPARSRGAEGFKPSAARAGGCRSVWKGPSSLTTQLPLVRVVTSSSGRHGPLRDYSATKSPHAVATLAPAPAQSERAPTRRSRQQDEQSSRRMCRARSEGREPATHCVGRFRGP